MYVVVRWMSDDGIRAAVSVAHSLGHGFGLCLGRQALHCWIVEMAIWLGLTFPRVEAEMEDIVDV